MFGGGFFGAGGPFGGGGGFPDMGGPGGPPRSDNTKYYKLLDVDRNASDAEVKKAHRKAALKHHPDKGRRQGGGRCRAASARARGGEGRRGSGSLRMAARAQGAARWRWPRVGSTPHTRLHAVALATVHGAAIPGRSCGDPGFLAKLPVVTASGNKSRGTAARALLLPPTARFHRVAT